MVEAPRKEVGPGQELLKTTSIPPQYNFNVEDERSRGSLWNSAGIVIPHVPGNYFFIAIWGFPKALISVSLPFLMYTMPGGSV